MNLLFILTIVGLLFFIGIEGLIVNFLNIRFNMKLVLSLFAGIPPIKGDAYRVIGHKDRPQVI